MAKPSQDKKSLEVITPSEAEGIAKTKRELAAQVERLEQERRAMQVERNAIAAQRSDLELARRQLGLDREHLRQITDEIARLARTI